MTGGNKSQASRILGISRPTLLKKLRSLEAREREAEAAEAAAAEQPQQEALIGAPGDTVFIR